MSHVDDGKLNALLDGELEGAEAAEVQAHIAACPECGKRLDEAKRFLSEAADLLGALELPPAAATPERDVRRVSKTAKEVALEVDDETGQSPAIGAAPPERLFRRGAQVRPEHHAFDYTSLAWAATIILAIGVGFLADEVRHVREGVPSETRTSAQAPGAPTGVGGAAATAKAAPEVAGGTGGAAAVTAAKPAASGRNGPPAAKAPPGEATVTAARSATGLGHKRLERPAPAVAMRAPEVQPARPAGNVTAAAPTTAIVTSSATPLDAASGAPAPVPAPASGGAVRGADRALAQSGAAETAGSPAAPAAFRRATLEEAVARLQGTIRLIDGLQSTRVEIGPGRLVPYADSTREVVRVIYGEPGSELVLEQQRLRVSQGVATAAPREAQVAPPALGPGDIVVTSSSDGLNGMRWMDRGVWLSLSGRVPADSLRRLADRVR